MKKVILLFCLFGIFSFGLSAQYNVTSFVNIGENPGGLNTDIEEPYTANPGWTQIEATSASPAWTAVQTLPFAFNFNGSAVTTFKVSTTGVLTFTTAASA